MMKLRFVALGASTLLAVACSLINSTEELKPVDPATGGTESGEGGSTAGTGNPSGGKSSGGVANLAGCGPSRCGGGGEGGDSSAGAGGAPPLGRDCDDSAADCGSTAPICDAAAGECRACATDEECSLELGRDFCGKAGVNRGRCVECRTDGECTGAKPVCGATGQCRGCSEHAECASSVCAPAGDCVPSTRSVYVLAETGSSNAACGTLDLPCRSTQVAAGKLTSDRPNLVLLKTSELLREGPATFPALQGLRVIGNGVVVHPYSGAAAFIVPAMSSVLFEDVVLEGSIGNEQGEDTQGNPVGAIICNSGAITVQGSTLRDNASGIRATDCDVTVTGSVLRHNAVPLTYGGAGIVSHTAVVSRKFDVRRNRFVDNGVATYNAGQRQATLENNLFLRNGADGYTRVIELRAEQTRFAYNTLVENYNGCTYVGVVACIGTCTNIGNVSHRSFPSEMAPCYDQVWYGGTLSYSLTEIAYPGSTNTVGDPQFVDPAGGDFTPGPSSPALDKGNPADAPDVDIDGRPRSGVPDMGAFEAQ